MRLQTVKRTIRALFTMALFALTGMAGAGPIIARISNMDTAQFSSPYGGDKVHVKRNRVETASPGSFFLSYQGIHDISVRPIDIHFTIRFESLDTIRVVLVGPEDQTAEIGVMTPTERLHYARDFRLNKPVLMRVELTKSQAFLYAGTYASEGKPLPAWTVEGIGLIGRNSQIEIYAVNVYSFKEGLPQRSLLKTTGGIFPTNGIAVVLVGMITGLLGVVLLWFGGRITQKFHPFQDTGGWIAAFWILFGAFWLFSWKLPRIRTMIIYLVALLFLKGAILLADRLAILPSSTARKMYPWIGIGAVFSLTITTIILFQSVSSMFLALLGVLVAWGSLPSFGYFTSKAMKVNLPSGIALDALLTAPLFVFSIGALVDGANAPGLLIGLGWAMTFSMRFERLFRLRKRLAGSQPALFMTIAFCILSLEFALGAALKAGPLPKVGTLLSADPRWVPNVVFSSDFAVGSRDGNLVFQNENMNIPKPDGEFRIVFLGGSTTYGHPTDSSLNFVSKVRDRLRTDFPDRNLRVYNCGYQGNGSLQMLLLYDHYLQDAEIDLLVIYTLNNDMYQPGIFTYREIWESQGGVLQTSVRTLRSALLESALYRMSVAVYHSLLQGRSYVPKKKIIRDFKRNMEDIVSRAAARNTKIILIPEMMNPVMATGQQKFLSYQMAEVLKRLGKSRGLTFIDTRDLKKSSKIFTDNVHLNAEGNSLIFRLIYPSIQSSIPQND